MMPDNILKSLSISRLLCMLCLLALLASTTSCLTTQFTPAGKGYLPFDGTVKILYARPNDIEYDQIGVISAECKVSYDLGFKLFTFCEQVDMTKALQKKAAKNGANAIIISNRSEKSTPYSYYYPGRGIETGVTLIRTWQAQALRIPE
ncbi:MAG: hypothetical protein KJ687_08485 [Proteobacteria bacterium]|nr:hypothetical protein [Pseudomonadota bacterium]